MTDHSHDGLDDNAKGHLDAFQPDFLAELEEAIAAGFEPDDSDPEYLTVEDDGQEAFDAMWAEVEQ